MSRGRRRNSNSDKRQRSPKPTKSSKASQGFAHRRGGTHRVRDADRTSSIYDDYNYKELLDAAKERDVYRKDMKKVEMAWALKRNDEEKKRAERNNLNALRTKQDEAKRERECIAAEEEYLLKAKHSKKAEKMKKRQRDESVSDDTLSDNEVEAEQETQNEYNREIVGQALSDSSWDSISTESIADFTDYTQKPSCKLQLLEWPHQTMPLANPVPRSHPFDLQPRPITYTPLKITTTNSKQKLCLPGARYPPAVDPDFVPLLSASVRAAAHNGRLEGILRNAAIETGDEWASRTLIQGYNATLYFHLGGSGGSGGNPGKSLAAVYKEYDLEKRRARRVEGKCDAFRGAREERKRMRSRIKGRLVAEVYETCTWRPGAVGYVPAYLDFGDGKKEERGRRLGNLRFVRFRGCDVPHYYFWVRDEEEGGEHVEKKSGSSGDEDGVVVEGKAFGMEGVGEECERKVRSARKRPCMSYTPPNNDSARGIECSGTSEAESIPDEADVDKNTEGLYRRTSSIPAFDRETSHGRSIAEWLKYISSALNALRTPLSLSEPSGFAEWDEHEDEDWGRMALYIPKRETGNECLFCGVSWTTMTPDVRTMRSYWSHGVLTLF
jgi:hypothetical protein